MNTFGEEFLAELESCVRSAGDARAAVLETWDPSRVAAPERHVACGTAHGLTHESIAYMLSRRNPALDRIGSMLDLHIRTVHCVAAAAAGPIDAEKEQVWLFGWAWFNAYYEFLTDSLTLRSEFYREHHTRFLALLERMLAFDPATRPRFRDVLAEWVPYHDLLKSPQSDASVDASASDDDASAAAATATATATVVSSVTAAATATATAPRQPRRRFVLTAVVDPDGRRKTRKAHHS